MFCERKTNGFVLYPSFRVYKANKTAREIQTYRSERGKSATVRVTLKISVNTEHIQVLPLAFIFYWLCVKNRQQSKHNAKRTICTYFLDGVRLMLSTMNDPSFFSGLTFGLPSFLDDGVDGAEELELVLLDSIVAGLSESEICTKI